jgi:hypothetical protein
MSLCSGGFVANLWRILAIAWLGGFASPVLAEEPPDLDAAPPAVADDYGSTVPLPQSGETRVKQTVDDIEDRTSDAPRE